MKLSRPITEIIKIRKSCRTYATTPIEKDKRYEIEKFINELSTENFRFVLIDRENGQITDEKLGTYGVIKGATTFVAGIMKKEFTTIEHFGYAFEKIVLFLTDMNLGTCWLGASFERKKISNRLHIGNSEIVPIITPLGYPGTGFNFHSTLVKLIARPDKRIPGDKLFFSDNFSTPLSAETAGNYGTVLEMVRLGPSAGNMQPWRILKLGNAFHFHLKRSSFYTNRLIYDIQRNDIGIAMCHFELVAGEMGLNGKWNTKKPEIPTGENSFEYIVSWNIN
jgi:nitroreductase